MNPPVEQPEILPSHAQTKTSRRPRRTGGAILVFLGIVQAIILLAHAFIYETWTVFRGASDFGGTFNLRLALGLLSISFIIASVLARNSYNFAVNAFYKITSVWMGMLNFFVVASVICWLVALGAWLSGSLALMPGVVLVTFGLALLATVYGVINARVIRVKKLQVALPDLPHAWRGRTAALVSDIHVGPVNGVGFMRKIVALLARQKPDIVLIPGDFYDGTKVDERAMADPWKNFPAPLGVYFATGNHEEFSDPAPFLTALSQAGVRVLENEKVTVDGLQIIGINDRDLADRVRLAALLESLEIDRNQASLLLAHTPGRVEVAEEAGISLQVSGHTHGGQVFPFTWFTHRIFKQFTYGLQRLGGLSVYTTYGVGTWGPPLRLGTRPEIVLIEFA